MAPKSRSKSKKKKSKRSRDKKKKKRGNKKTDSSEETQGTENEEEDICEPLQKLKSSDFLPEEAKEAFDLAWDERIRDGVMATRKFLDVSVVKLKFKKAVLEAAADITSEFHEQYMTRLEACNVYDTLVGCNHPQSTFDTIKKGFLSYLNSTGHYLQIRERLRSAVGNIVKKNFGALKPEGFNEVQDFQNFVHNLYTVLADTLQETLMEAEVCEGIGWNISSVPLSRRNVPSVEQRLTLRDLHFFAQEAMVLGDLENAQRLHLQRICQNINNPTYWLDFAIMWAERGEDKMTEIALREVLKLEPDNVLGLLMMGIIAARNKNPSAIPLIGHALRLRPLSPEILVILATAYRLLGREKESKYFFLKARCVHLHLTGGDPSKVEAALQSLDFSLSPLSPTKGDKRKKKKKKRGKGKSRSTSGGSKISKRSKSSGSDSAGSKKKSQRKKKNKSKSSSEKSAPSDIEEKTSKARSKSRKKHKMPKTADAGVGELNAANLVLKDKDTLFTGGDRPGLNKRSLPMHVSYYDFPIEVAETTMPQPPLGSLNPYLRITWDVTVPAFPGTAQDDSSPLTPASDESLKLSVKQAYDSIISDHPRSMEFINENTLLEELQNFVNNDVKPIKHPGDSGPETPKTPRSDRKKKRESPRGSGKSNKSRKSDKSSSSGRSGKSKKSNRSNKSKKSSKSKTRPRSTDAAVDSISTARASAEKNIQAAEFVDTKMWDYRYGSEYIWTAQLLLKLHAYDFLDLTLAKELYFSNHQSVPFTYILASSWHLRGQQDVALRLLTETLRRPGFCKNLHLLELKAHILMGKGDLEEAQIHFETAIKLAQSGHNLHLAYLQLGNLFIAKGEQEQAKSTLLNCVSLYPSLYSWLALGNLCYKVKKQKRLQEYSYAEIAYAHANRLDSTNPEIWGMLSLISLAQGNQMLAEQAYKWAIRFGLPSNGKLMDDLKNMQITQGYGDPASSVIPECVPHDYYLQRLGKQFPIQFYREILPVSKNPSCTNVLQEQELRHKLMQRIQTNNNTELEG